MNTRPLAAASVAATLDAAESMLANAHHALGRMSACQSAPEFSKATADFLAVARDVSGRIARLAALRTDDPELAEYATWLGELATRLAQHPLDSERTRRALAIRQTRTARGSDPPYGEALDGNGKITIGKLGGWVLADSISSSRPDDFYFQHLEDRPAITMCADYLDTIAKLLAAASKELRRRALA